LLSVLKLTAFIVKEDFCIENVTDASIFCIQNLFKGKDDQLSVIGRLAAGACAGMTSTLVSNCGLIYSCLLYLFIRFRVYSFVGVN
jgi:hypothetical protein